jgi:hypothetical protein
MLQDSGAFVTFGPFGQVDYAPHNKGVTPIFFLESVIDPAASEKAGRAIYQDMERVRIYVAGDQFSVAVHPVGVPIWGNDTAEDRFPEEYQKWKRKGQMHINGTPLAKWPLATPSFIKEMEFHNIFSVDDLASIADVHLDRIADGRQWRDRAAAWLKSANEGAVAAQYAAENARLRDDLKRLEARVSRMLEKSHDAEIEEMELEAQERPAPRKPMSTEHRAAISASLKAARAAKRAQG